MAKAEELTQMDDAQLDKTIQGGDTVDPEPVEADKGEPQGDQPEAPESLETDVVENELSEEHPEAADASAAQETPEQLYKRAQDELKKAQDQIREKELMLQRQANEIGAMRRLAMAPQIDPVKIREEIKELAQTDPEQAQRRLQALAHYEEERRRAQIDLVIPDYPNLIPAIAEMLTSQGEAPEMVEQYKADPRLPPVQVLERLSYAARAYIYAKAKDAEMEALKRTIQAPIPQPRKQAPVIRAAAPGSSSAVKDASQFSRIGEQDLSNMTDAQLEQFLAKNKGK